LRTGEAILAIGNPYGLSQTVTQGIISGVELVAIYPGSPALRAGLRPDDIITHMNDQPIQVSRQALNIVAALMPGDTLRLRGIRAGRPFALEARVAERPVT
jgi:serine protease DegS